MRDANCIFCKIIEKKVPAEIVYEDDDAVAFLDVEPHAPGHTLIIPKQHAELLENLPDEKIKPLFLAVKRVAGMVVRGLGADGGTIGINQSAAAGQVVGHLHVHVLPRFYGDGGGAIQSVVRNKTKESLKEVRKKIVGQQGS